MNFTELTPIILAAQDFEHRMGLPAVLQSEGGWIVVQPDPPLVILLDASLQVVRQLPLPVFTEDYVRPEVAGSGDGRFLAISARTRIEIFDSDGESLHKIAYAPLEFGNSCCFDANGKLWCVQPEASDGCDHLIIIDPEAGEVLAEQAIRDENGSHTDVGHFSFYSCPNGVDMLLNLACGQDGSYLFLAHRTAQSLKIDAYPFDDRTFSGGFSPNGREFVTGAHQGDSLKIHAFPSGQVLASVDSELLFDNKEEAEEDDAEDDDAEDDDAEDDDAEDDDAEDDDAEDDDAEDDDAEDDDVGYQALYLDDTHLLVGTGFGRLLLLDRETMQPAGNISLPDFPLQGYDNHGNKTDDPGKAISYETGLSSIHPAGSNRVLAVYNERHFRLLDLSEVLAGVLKGE